MILLRAPVVLSRDETPGTRVVESREMRRLVRGD
jgi:hypothetical protein